MSKLPSIRAKRLIKALVRGGFYIYHQRGSHVQLRHRVKTHLRVTVPRHDRFDLPPTIVHSIMEQAELTRTDLLKLLARR